MLIWSNWIALLDIIIFATLVLAGNNACAALCQNQAFRVDTRGVRVLEAIDIYGDSYSSKSSDPDICTVRTSTSR
jgi:hypothetical protein